MRPVVGILRERGVRCVIYIDDMLILNASREMLQRHTALIITLLECLGFQVNYLKSHLIPTKKLDFLGFVVDSVKRKLSLPKEKVGAIKKEAIRLSKQEVVSARILSRLVGMMSAAVLAVFPAPLHYRSLRVLKHKALKAAGYDNSISISQEARKDQAGWARNLCQWNGRRLFPAEPHGATRRANFTSTCWSC